MTPEQTYINNIKQHNFTPDPVQEEAVRLTQSLYLQQIKRNTHTDSSFQKRKVEIIRQLPKMLFQWLLNINIEPVEEKAMKGLYFWGGVGTGKTWLIDSFYNSLPFSEKRRVHFHRLMQEVHEQLKELPRTPDPLPIVARHMAQKYQLLCIDEFHVSDIADAMILAGLLESLFSEGMILVITSNIAPDQLYKNGLQRGNFLPAIKLIKQHSVIYEFNNTTDYRSLILEKEGYFHIPVNPRHIDMMTQHFIQITQHAPIMSHSIIVNQREIQVKAVNHSSPKHPANVIWFDFDALCNTPRSSSDYLWLAHQYVYILVSGIYAMDEETDDIAKRFMHLIDALYDEHCLLVISAEAEPDQLYQGRKLKQPFQRTTSRLKEMRSRLYRGLNQ